MGIDLEKSGDKRDKFCSLLWFCKSGKRSIKVTLQERLSQNPQLVVTRCRPLVQKHPNKASRWWIQTIGNYCDDIEQSNGYWCCDCFHHQSRRCPTRTSLSVFWIASKILLVVWREMSRRNAIGCVCRSRFKHSQVTWFKSPASWLNDDLLRSGKHFCSSVKQTFQAS